MKHSRGFTLLEVLVALAILALSAATVIRQTQLGVKQQYDLEMKSSALWIADDVLTGLLAQAQWPPIGRNQQTKNYQAQEWVVVTDVQAAPDPMLRKIDISVNIAGRDENAPALFSITAYRGQY